MVISNGAFCLAPDKPAAFREALRVLRPGGRAAIALSTIKASLQPGVEWPLCIRMFVGLHELQPMVEQAGFVDVVVDTSDTLFAFDLDEDGGTAADLDEGGHTTAELAEGGGGATAAPQPPTQPPCPRGAEGATEASEDTARRARNQVHVGSREFEHLRDYDMNALCARVVVVATRPGAGT